MKHSLMYATLATLLLAGCTQDEVIQLNEASEQIPIGFSTYVDNPTRAVGDETTESNLTKFRVWGTKLREGNTEAVRVFNGIDVTKNGTNWTYSPVDYWILNNAYSFTAIGCQSTNRDYYTYTPTDVNDINTVTYLSHYQGTIKINNSTAQGNQDLVWASNKVDYITEEIKAPEKVTFNFGHLLSRVNLKFVNLRSDKIEVSNIKIKSASTATLNFGDYLVGTPSNDFKWAVSTSEGSYECNFIEANSYYQISGYQTTDGSEEKTYNSQTTKNKFLIPNQTEITVSFSVATSLTNNGTADIHKTIKFGSDGSPAPFQDLELKPGYSYTLVAYIDDTIDQLGSIAFDIKVDSYIDNSAPAYAMKFNTPNAINTSNNANASNSSTTISVKKIVSAEELVYYGNIEDAPEIIDYSKFTYKWTIPVNENYTFNSENDLKSKGGTPVYEYSQSGISNVNDLKVVIWVNSDFDPNNKGVADADYTDVGFIPVTLTILDSENHIKLSETVNVQVNYTWEKPTASTTGGSQDGNDNDG